MRQVVIASNRGPVSFAREDNELVVRRGGGGLVTALTGALQRSGGLWVAVAMSAEVRKEAEARIAHVHHPPSAGPSHFRVLPAEVREELLGGLLGADVLGFQSQTWADAFLLDCRGLAGARVDLRRRLVRWEWREVRIRV